MKSNSKPDYKAQHEILDDLVRGDSRQQAIRDLAAYFADPEGRNRGFSGRRFERFADSAQTADEVTAADVLALSMLSVERGLGRVAVAVLETRIAEVNSLLGQIPDLALHELDVASKAGTIGEGSSAWKLWEVLAGATGGYRPATAYKLMARKRPALFPAFDSMVARALGVRRQDFDPWDCLWEYFHGDRSRIAAVEELRAAVGGIGDISLLRCIDVALWMRGKRGS